MISSRQISIPFMDRCPGMRSIEVSEGTFGLFTLRLAACFVWQVESWVAVLFEDVS